MLLKIYDIENGNLDDNCILVAEIIGETNLECEQKANEQYGDTDKFAWSYC